MRPYSWLLWALFWPCLNAACADPWQNLEVRELPPARCTCVSHRPDVSIDRAVLRLAAPWPSWRDAHQRVSAARVDSRAAVAAPSTSLSRVADGPGAPGPSPGEASEVAPPAPPTPRAGDNPARVDDAVPRVADPAAAAAAVHGDGAGASAVAAPSCIDLSQATVAELVRLPGVGQARAEAIIAARERRPFKRPQELTRIKGIGRKSLAKITPLLCPMGTS